MIISELDMVKWMYKYLTQQGYKCTIEVPFMGRSVDFVYKEENKYISIEFKLHPCKQLIIQAKDQLKGFNKVYVCTLYPQRGYKQTFLDELKKNNIGLFTFCQDAGETLLTCCLSCNMNKIDYKYYKDRVKEGFEHSLKYVPPLNPWMQKYQ